MKTTEQQIIAKQDELIAWLVKYTKPESIRYDMFRKELAALKAQLKEQEGKPIYDENYLNDCIKRATPRLSKIKDVDEYLHEIKSGVNIKDELVVFLIWYQPDNEVAEDLIDKYLNNQP